MPLRLFRNVGYVAIVMVATIAAMVYYRYGINSDLLLCYAHRFHSLTVLWPTIIGTVYTTDVIKIGWQSVSLALPLYLLGIF